MTPDYRRQHQLRLSYMPWLYFRLKAKHLAWAQAWQADWQQQLQQLENVRILGPCFIAPQAQLFAEPGRPIEIGAGSFIAADAVLHGPITLGERVGINHHVSMDGGRHGIRIGDGCRIAAYSHFYAFDHGLSPDRWIVDQGTRSQGITLGQDVWVGAHAGICDGSQLEDHSVLGMNALLRGRLPAWKIAAGNPATLIGDRRTKALTGDENKHDVDD